MTPTLASTLASTLALQRSAYFKHPIPDFAERKADLRALQRFVKENREAMCDAINADYGNRSRHETQLAEIFPTVDGVDHVLKHLPEWMRTQRRTIDRIAWGAGRNRVIPQPLGVVGVIVPWNFPINLSFIPLTYIFAAGNRAMVKMSENSRHLAALLIELAPTYFPQEKLAFFDETGGVGIEFSQLPFDHIMFTGSGQTGRAVMAAAARNLCPVTLELGGKAPAIVCEDYPVKKAVDRIMYVKCLNAGQICTSVDHVYVPERQIDEFVRQAKQILPTRYPRLDTTDYTSIIDERAFARLTAALDEARAGGATLIPLLPGAAWDAATRKINPHIVLNVPDGCALAEREIFGPILPIIGYTSLDTVIDRINARPRPLAVYPFSNVGRTVDHILERVISGGVSVNDAVFHVGQHDLPFGGVGESGMGHYHGREGFETFSKLRPVFYQASFSTLKFLAPPYGKFADRMLAFLMK
jgi:coniferyl-aldehyde dehydrogenase